MNKGVGGRQVVVHNCSKPKSGPRTNLFLLPKQPELGRAARTLEWCLFLGGLAAFAPRGLVDPRHVLHQILQATTIPQDTAGRPPRTRPAPQETGTIQAYAQRGPVQAAWATRRD